MSVNVAMFNLLVEKNKLNSIQNYYAPHQLVLKINTRLKSSSLVEIWHH